MSDYTDKIFSFFSKKHNALRSRKELLDYAMSKKEYFDDFLRYEVSLLDKLKIRDFHTTDYNYTGSYDFHFSVESVVVSIGSGFYENSLYDEIVSVEIKITPGGTVDIYNNYDDVVTDTLKISESVISNHTDGWEISMEIIDIIPNIIISDLPELITNTRLFDIVEIYINYPD